MITQTVIIFIILFELLPTHLIKISSNDYAFHNTIPPVYTYIENHSEINSIVILRSNVDYKNAPIPVARAEDVLWAGYHNKNIFNGYSGYEPPEYAKLYADFVDFHSDDIKKMQTLGIRYILVDTLLSSSDSELITNTRATLDRTVYRDNRYELYEIES